MNQIQNTQMIFCFECWKVIICKCNLKVDNHQAKERPESKLYVMRVKMNITLNMKVKCISLNKGRSMNFDLSSNSYPKSIPELSLPIVKCQAGIVVDLLVIRVCTPCIPWYPMTGYKVSPGPRRCISLSQCQDEADSGIISGRGSCLHHGHSKIQTHVRL